MIPIINSTAAPVSPAQLRQAEKELGLLLPQPYRDFLLKHNGGEPVPNTFRFADGKTREVLNWFFSIEDKEDSLVDLAKAYRGCLHSDLLPIAADPFGNLVAIGVKGTCLGQIYFWLHETELPADTPLPNRDCLLVASSFNVFINGFG
ncbi:SMI1/KNR4 family protein [Exilibacterium tricleocarpae]|uniref:SMI1/KNR4 family protein n=1 Tax=Exilibacterium tricleocarpae TaxID=2591008 RepID=A0A545T5Q5_9GAMM|nr:SMI1/KNR4 family protein [Exilibacterium tricleocarpae]TQV72571.1 SMI1/KNR4 family protein [Exilibacterium tricleocarpae]